MSMSLTHMQAQLLAFIERFQAENNGVAPSFEEMKQELGLASKSGVHRLLSALEERRRIIRSHNRARAIEIITERQELPELAYFPTHMLVAELARRHESNRRAA